jgi:lipopolysaccharide transport protein LptA
VPKTVLARLPFLLCVLAFALDARAQQGAAALSFLVAPFERIAPAGTTLPDTALLLADRLATRGVGKVVGPGQAGLPIVASPTDEQVRGWASQNGVGLVITGSSTRVGKRTSLDLRLRSAGSGAVVGTYVAEAPQPEDLEGAVDRLAAEIVAGAPTVAAASAPAQAAPAPTPPAVAARPAEASQAAVAPAAAAEAARPEADDGGGSGFLGVTSGSRNDAPIAIKSDELEALQQGGERRFVFKRNVRAKQGDMELTSRELEAYYPPGASNPEKLIAIGSVKLVQAGGKEAHCDRATYLRAEQKVICTGDNVELLQNGDRVRGKEIEFYLNTDRLVVRGGADVFLESGEPPGPAPAPAASASSGGGTAPATGSGAPE